jgi:hypothetical protein
VSLARAAEGEAREDIPKAVPAAARAGRTNRRMDIVADRLESFTAGWGCQWIIKGVVCQLRIGV